MRLSPSCSLVLQVLLAMRGSALIAGQPNSVITAPPSVETANAGLACPVTSFSTPEGQCFPIVPSPSECCGLCPNINSVYTLTTAGPQTGCVACKCVRRPLPATCSLKLGCQDYDFPQSARECSESIAPGCTAFGLFTTQWATDKGCPSCYCRHVYTEPYECKKSSLAVAPIGAGAVAAPEGPVPTPTITARSPPPLQTGSYEQGAETGSDPASLIPKVTGSP